MLKATATKCYGLNFVLDATARASANVHDSLGLYTPRNQMGNCGISGRRGPLQPGSLQVACIGEEEQHRRRKLAEHVMPLRRESKVRYIEPLMQPPPPPVPARKTQRSGATFRRAVFSAKEVPGAQDLSPRTQTHLPFGCSVVGVMWKPKASLNLQKKKISSLGLYMVPDQCIVRICHWSSGICTGLQVAKRGFKPH